MVNQTRGDSEKEPRYISWTLAVEASSARDADVDGDADVDTDEGVAGR